MSNDEKISSATEEEKTTSGQAGEQGGTAKESGQTGSTKESAWKAVCDMLATLNQLRTEKPKIFYGGAGIVAIILLYLMIGGGNSGKISGSAAKNLVVGQEYVLRSPNTYEPESTVRLVSVPGEMAAYDDTEKADREGCKHLPQGTRVIVKDFYAAYGKPKAFVKVAPVSGECQGTLGWTLAINIQEE